MEKNKLKELWNFFKLPLIVFIVVFTLFRVVIFHGYVPSGSMETTIRTKSWIVGDRISLLLDKERKSIKRYDVIVFKTPAQEEHLVKRVIGLPGDKIKITESEIYINGVEARKDFTSSIDKYQMRDEFEVPKGCYFVCGDNRGNSNDSRKWADKFVKKDEIKAKVWFNYWFWHFEKLKHYEDNIKNN